MAESHSDPSEPTVCPDHGTPLVVCDQPEPHRYCPACQPWIARLDDRKP